MNTRRLLPALLWAFVILLGPLAAQPTVGPPGYDVALLAGGIPIDGQLTSMDVDLYGNVYILDEPFGPSSTSGPRVHRIRRNGMVDLDHATGFGDAGQLARNPVDGLVYLIDVPTTLPVITTRVWLIDPAGGKVLVDTVPLVAEGFTIDNLGRMIFGGTGFQGQGLYRQSAGGNSLTFLGPGFGSNSILQSLVSGDILIADGKDVRRWTPLAPGTLPYYEGPPILPNMGVSVRALARSPFDRVGSGAAIGVNSFTTLCLCGDGLVVTNNLTGTDENLFATEAYSFPSRGLQSLASGLRHDLYQADVTQGIVPGLFAVIHRIQENPISGGNGSLIVDVQPGLLTFNVYGLPSGGDPLLLGVMPALTTTPNDGLFVGPFGILDLDIFSPDYLTLVDGIGVFGPPDPFGQVPAGGHFVLSFSIPPIPGGLGFRAQAEILEFPHAPNGLFTISNVEHFILN